MRLAPIDRPKGLAARIAYRVSRRRWGRVLTSMKVVNARMPKSFRSAYELAKLEEKGLSLEPALRLLVKAHVARLNGCNFCVDLAQAAAVEKQLPLEKHRALDDYRTSSLFSPRERAALAYAEEATRVRRVSDATFSELQAHFSDREIAELTWLNAVENYYNLITLPLEIEADGLCMLAPAGRRKKEGSP